MRQRVEFRMRNFVGSFAPSDWGAVEAAELAPPSVTRRLQKERWLHAAVMTMVVVNKVRVRVERYSGRSIARRGRRFEMRQNSGFGALPNATSLPCLLLPAFMANASTYSYVELQPSDMH